MAEMVEIKGTPEEPKVIEAVLAVEEGSLEIPKDLEFENIYEPKGEEEDGKGESGTSEEGKGEGERKEEEKEVATPPPDKSAEELAELRQVAREQKRQLDKMMVDLSTAQEALKKAEILPPDDAEAIKKSEEFKELKAFNLDTILEIMELNPKFEDVREVVSQRHFDDLIEAMAKYVVAEEGGSLSEQVVRIETAVWKMTNPYKYMYTQIKNHHPDYVKLPVEERKVEEKKVAGTKESVNPPKIPGSIHNLQGGSSGSGGWTSSMIDALDEMELSKVPREVYDAYLRNELK